MPYPLPDELTRVPGLLGETTDWIEASMFHPNRPLAFAAAVSAVAVALSGKVRFNGTGSEIRVIAVAHSGTGKTDALNSAEALLERAGMGDCLSGGFASPEAVHDARDQGTPVFWREEHFDLWNCQGRQPGSILARAFDDDGWPVVFHGHCTPVGFYEAHHTSERFRFIADGSLVINADSSAKRQDESNAPDVPDALADVIAGWRAVHGCVEVEATSDAKAVRMRRGRTDTIGRRSLANRLALIHAASVNPGQPVIDCAAVEWAWWLVNSQRNLV